MLYSSELTPLLIQDKTLLPVVQGGMGVGISAHSLAGAVAKCGAMGTIASIDLRHLHADLVESTNRLRGSEAKEQINLANQEALRREIKLAKNIAQGNGMIAVNVMRAVTAYADYVSTALQEGIDALVVGAGLPLDLPVLTAEYPKVALIPILSDARGVKLVLKKWARYNRMPAAIVLEHPGYAAGHLGTAAVSDLNDPRFNFDVVIPETLKVLMEFGIENVPVIAAGGIRTYRDIKYIQSLGGAGAQLGTPFAVTVECDASLDFKSVLAEATDDDLIEFMSAAGLPSRAVKTPWLVSYLAREETLKKRARKTQCVKFFDCLSHCGLRDGVAKSGQFCIDHQLTLARKGAKNKGLFFRGAGELPFGNQIRTVKELFDTLLHPEKP